MRKQLADIDPKALELHDQLKAWVRRNSIALNTAGNMSLLPHKNRQEHLLKTHFVLAELTPLGKGDFEIKSAAVQPQEVMKMMRVNSGGEDEYERTMARERSELLPTDAGTMYIVCIISGTGLFHVKPFAVAQADVETMKKMPETKDWVRRFSFLIVNSGNQTRMTADGTPVHVTSI